MKHLLIVFAFGICFDKIHSQNNFTVYSSKFENNGNYPKLYTCDSSGISPTVSWKNIPKGTISFAVTMHHIPKDGGKHVYMILYNIPANILTINESESKNGIWGGNTQNRNAGYSPPCSKGPGPKSYIITVYALNKILPAFNHAITLEELNEAMKDAVLASNELKVIYSRP